jgi:hypothetical protein
MIILTNQINATTRTRGTGNPEPSDENLHFMFVWVVGMPMYFMFVWVVGMPIPSYAPLGRAHAHSHAPLPPVHTGVAVGSPSRIPGRRQLRERDILTLCMTSMTQQLPIFVLDNPARPKGIF